MMFKGKLGQFGGMARLAGGVKNKAGVIKNKTQNAASVVGTHSSSGTVFLILALLILDSDCI